MDDAHGLVKTIFAEFSTDRGGFESPKMDIKTVDFIITLQNKGYFSKYLIFSDLSHDHVGPMFTQRLYLHTLSA